MLLCRGFQGMTTQVKTRTMRLQGSQPAVRRQVSGTPSFDRTGATATYLLGEAPHRLRQSSVGTECARPEGAFALAAVRG